MSGSLPKNLRSAFLNEEFGAFMLRRLGALAEISRAEDYGIDGFLTLMREVLIEQKTKHSPNSAFRPGSTMLVQLKAKTVKIIKADQVGPPEWLKKLELPLFYVRVSQPSKAFPLMEVYSSHLVYDELCFAPDTNPFDVCFDSENSTGTTSRYMSQALSVGSSGFLPKLNDEAAVSGNKCIWLGPPVLAFALDELEEQGFPERCLDILEAWIAIEQANRKTAPFLSFGRVEWRMNELPPPKVESISYGHHASISPPPYVEHLAPSVNAFIADRLTRGSEEEVETAERMRAFVSDNGGSTFSREVFEEMKRNFEAMRCGRVAVRNG